MVLVRVGSLAVGAFASQMFVTGVVAVILCPVGRSARLDQIHVAASAAYILDHFVLLSLLGIAMPYAAGFVLGGAGLFASLAAKERHMRDEARARNAEVESRRRQDVERINFAMDERFYASRRRFRAQLGVMIFENGLFVAFVCGMASGLEV
eukprot:3278415-Prymnesium_polylepis.1